MKKLLAVLCAILFPFLAFGQGTPMGFGLQTVQTAQAASTPTCTLELIPSTIEIGESSTLAWSLTGNPIAFSYEAATSDGGAGFGIPMPKPTGSMSVAPLRTTTYTGTVVSASGATSTCVTVLTVRSLLGMWEVAEWNDGASIEDNGVISKNPEKASFVRVYFYGVAIENDVVHYWGSAENSNARVEAYHYRNLGMLDLFTNVSVPFSASSRFTMNSFYKMFIFENYGTGRVDGELWDSRFGKPIEIFHSTATMCRGGCKG